MSYNWRTRPDCITEGCDVEARHQGMHCRNHDPRRCAAPVSPKTHTDEGEGRCRNLSSKGGVFCKRHLRGFGGTNFQTKGLTISSQVK